MGVRLRDSLSRIAQPRKAWMCVAAFVAIWLTLTCRYLDHRTLVQLWMQDGPPASNQSPAAAEGWQCLSKSQHPSYFSPSRLFPMTHKLSLRLQEYEAMHRRCTLGRDWAEEMSDPTDTQAESQDPACQYALFMEVGGLGNRLLGLVSAFVYCLLTNRALVLSHFSAAPRLLCNPFASSDWALPSSAPLSKLMKAQVALEDVSRQDFSNVTVVKLKQQHGQSTAQKRFYCTATQEQLASVKWVTFESNQYMVPRFFIMPFLWPQMVDLFGEQPTAIFVQISRHILLPTNYIWDRILRVYWAYMADASKRVGVQIRTNEKFQFQMEGYNTVMRCLVNNGLVPNVTEVDVQREKETSTLHQLSDLLQTQREGGMWWRKRSPQNAAADAAQARPVSVFIASLQRAYHDQMLSQYSSRPTADGSLVRVHQETADKGQTFQLQQLEDAFTEMWLLALTDVVATTADSTFGYLGQAMGGMDPYIMFFGGKRGCVQPGTREPCYHFPHLDSVCVDHSTNVTEPGMNAEQEAWVQQHITRCIDEPRGIQLKLPQ